MQQKDSFLLFFSYILPSITTDLIIIIEYKSFIVLDYKIILILFSNKLIFYTIQVTIRLFFWRFLRVLKFIFVDLNIEFIYLMSMVLVVIIDFGLVQGLTKLSDNFGKSNKNLCCK